MREIKFRAIRRDLANEQFPELYEKKTMKFVYGTGVYQDTHNTWLILENPKKETFNQMSASIVDPKSVGQYVGLKDKNGVEIYEGDVVTAREKSDKAPFKGYVHYLNAQYWVNYIGYESYYVSLMQLHNSVYETIEVIGNIYRNTEDLPFCIDPTELHSEAEAEG